MARSAYQKLAPNPPPPRCWPSVFNGECFINAVRTTQASFGWDWGPAFPIQGFWKTPSLRFNVFWLGDGLRFFPTLEGTIWRAAVSVEIIGGKPGSMVRVSVKIGSGLMKNWEKRCVLIKRNVTDVWMELPLNGNLPVVPWWPIGVHSGPKLYSLMVQLRDDWGGHLLDSRLFRVGFRQVELIQEDVKVDGQNFGKTFFFRINRVPIFVRGSNWIPSTPFPSQKNHQGDSRTVRDSELLYSAARSGIQMLRVWGGGRYEDRRFYDLASQIGIMIWQDMMFACAMYKKPADGE
nr:hypothetical transcript [Hymenolepis microstoma]